MDDLKAKYRESLQALGALVAEAIVTLDTVPDAPLYPKLLTKILPAAGQAAHDLGKWLGSWAQPPTQ